jgi:hypothetical protein
VQAGHHRKSMRRCSGAHHGCSRHQLFFSHRSRRSRKGVFLLHTAALLDQGVNRHVNRSTPWLVSKKINWLIGGSFCNYIEIRKHIFGGLKAYLRPPRTIPLAILLVEINSISILLRHVCLYDCV